MQICLVSSKPTPPHKANLIVELEETKKDLAQKEESVSQMMERLQRLEDSQDRQNHERRWGPRKATRYHLHYGSHEEDDEDWRMQHHGERHHHQHHRKPMSNVKLPSFNVNFDPNVYLGWEAKVEQIFSVYDVNEKQRVKLASLEFKDYTMQWWHKIVMDMG